MQWSAAENAGFTEGTPWLGVNPNYRTVNAEAQLADPGSVHACYKELIRLRRQFPVFVDGSFSPLLEGDEQRFAYIRRNASEELLVTGNFGGTETEDPGLCSGDGWELLISSCPDAPVPGRLRPFEARIYRRVFAAEN